MRPLLDAVLPRLAEADLLAALNGGRYMSQDISRVYEPLRTMLGEIGDEQLRAAGQSLVDAFDEATRAKLNEQGRLSSPVPPTVVSSDEAPLDE